MASVAPRKPRSRSLDQASLHESGVRLLRLRISRRQHDGSRSPRSQGSGTDTTSSSRQDCHVSEARGLLKHNALALKNVARSLLGSPGGGRTASGGGGSSSGTVGKAVVHGSGLTKAERPRRSSSIDREETAGFWVNKSALINEVCSSPYRRRHSMTPSMGASSCSPPLRRQNLQLMPCHQTPSVALPPDPPKPFLVGGRVFYFYSSDDWRAAFQNQDRRAAAAAAAAAKAPSCSLHPSSSGEQLGTTCTTSQRQQPWNSPEPDRLAPQLPDCTVLEGGSPQRRYRSCSVGTACDAANHSLVHPGVLNLNFDCMDDDDEDVPGPIIHPACSYMRPRAASEQYASPLHMVSTPIRVLPYNMVIILLRNMFLRMKSVMFHISLAICALQKASHFEEMLDNFYLRQLSRGSCPLATSGGLILLPDPQEPDGTECRCSGFSVQCLEIYHNPDHGKMQEACPNVEGAASFEFEKTSRLSRYLSNMILLLCAHAIS
ncbi:uncharacterized protein [Palaemon carinicauda]|uniref:uncharacterized protein n=1 Tax=Palaemon carinicauda TaxID=392227 RepID=UPI0035B669FC